MSTTGKYQFLFRNLLKGIAWLTLLIIFFIFVKDSIDFESENSLMRYGNNAFLVFGIYVTSEVFMGVIPPELFMMWSLELAEHRSYALDVSLLAIISYAAGILTYYFGRYFSGTVLYRYLRKRYLRKYEELFNQYGGFLLFVAAITPVPYSAICMLVGSAKYPIRHFFSITLFRLVRFAVYGYFVWQASLI